MRLNIKQLAWCLGGVAAAHVVHFVYQRYVSGNSAVNQLSEGMALTFGELLKLTLQLVTGAMSMLASSRPLIFAAIILLLILAIFLVGIKRYTKIKNAREFQAKIKEAEALIAAARDEAAGEMQRVRDLEEKQKAAFENKEKALQREVEEKLKEYTARIKKLEKERLELKEIVGGLMRQLKNP